MLCVLSQRSDRLLSTRHTHSQKTLGATRNREVGVHSDAHGVVVLVRRRQAVRRREVAALAHTGEELAVGGARGDGALVRGLRAAAALAQLEDAAADEARRAAATTAAATTMSASQVPIWKPLSSTRTPRSVGGTSGKAAGGSRGALQPRPRTRVVRVEACGEARLRLVARARGHLPFLGTTTLRTRRRGPSRQKRHRRRRPRCTRARPHATRRAG